MNYGTILSGDFMVKRIIFDIDGTLITGINFFPYLINVLNQYGINDLEKAKQFLLNIKEYENLYNCYDRDLYLGFFSVKLNLKLDHSFLEIFFQELKNQFQKILIK